MNKHTLKIDCPDRKGLVHDITHILLNHNVNVVESDQYTDSDASRFFMRTEFNGTFDSGVMYDDLKAALGEEADIKLHGKRKKNIIVMATKEHHCLGDILVRHFFNNINANILAVISNYDSLREFTEKMGVPYHYISHENISREEHERKIINIIDQYSPEYIVLAKYMRILSSSFTDHYLDQIINIHHSFLPAFIGANPYRQAYERGVKIIGATAHFVNQDLDDGPIIEQNVINITHKQNAEALARAGRDVEKAVLAKAMEMVFDDRVFVSNNHTIIFK